MAKPPALPKPTLTDLRAEGAIPDEALSEIERLSVRCLQILEEKQILESEYGFKDHAGVRHVGVIDELEALFITHNLTARGLRMENYTAVYGSGMTPPRIDPHLLLAEGVEPEVIKRCTVSAPWVSLYWKRDAPKRGGGQEQD